jgi:hypothetical protein
MTCKPGSYLLVGNDLGVHVPAKAKRHHEKPGFNDLAGKNVGDVLPLFKIDLGRLAGGNINIKASPV